jgi:hypothetical protein
MSATHNPSGRAAVNFRLPRSGGTAPGGETGALLAVAAPVDALDPRQCHQPGDLLAVPPVAAVADLGNQPT